MASRIQKSIRNAQVNVIFYVITMVLAFFSRKIFLDNLGTEFLGLSSALGDILTLMNITELGIGTAVGVTLYKPLFSNDQEHVREIISVFGFLYSRIGIFIISIGVIISCFFPLIFDNIEVPLWLVYFMFFSMLYSSLLGYFVNYRQIILSASQQNYVIRLRYDTINLIKILLQLGSSYLPYNYVWWILIEVFTITAYSIVINYFLHKHYPWLDTSIKQGKTKFREYRELWNKTKQVFAFKLSNLIFNGSINILIGIFASLSMVTMYGNYNMLMVRVTTFFDGLFAGMGASIGNLIAEGNKAKTTKIFFELLSIRYVIAGLCSITLYFTLPKFIVIWLGTEYILPDSILFWLSVHMFILQSRLTVTNFKDAYGLFQDVWAPIAEILISLGLAFILGRKYTIVGILFAFTFADFLIKVVWQPYYLCKKGLEISVLRDYFPVFIKYIILLLLCLCTTYYIQLYLSNYLNNSIIAVLSYCLGVGGVVLCLLIILFFLFDLHFRNFIKHMVRFKKNKV